jgi:hypothetical protein
MRKFLALIGFVDLAWLIDYDGSRSLRIIRKDLCSNPYCERVGLNIHPIALLPGGLIADGAYVVRWQPASKGAEKYFQEAI